MNRFLNIVIARVKLVLQVPEGNQVSWVQPENMVSRVTEDQEEGKDRKDREDNQEFLENRD